MRGRLLKRLLKNPGSKKTVPECSFQTALWGWPSKMWQRVSMVKIIGIGVTSDSAKLLGD
jgi:hypothetical protein